MAARRPSSTTTYFRRGRRPGREPKTRRPFPSKSGTGAKFGHFAGKFQSRNVLHNALAAQDIFPWRLQQVKRG